RSCSYNSEITQFNRGQDDGIHAQPAKLSNADRCGFYVLGIIYGMVISRYDTHSRSDVGILADFDPVPGFNVVMGRIAGEYIFSAHDIFRTNYYAGVVNSPGCSCILAQDAAEEKICNV